MYENLINNFDLSSIDPSTTVVRCETQDEADVFLDYLFVKGVWDKKQISNLKDRWEERESETCYHLTQRSWCYASWYAETHPELSIVDFCDIYVPLLKTNITNISLTYNELFE